MKRTIVFLLLLLLLPAAAVRADAAEPGYANASLFAALLDEQGISHGEIAAGEGEGVFTLAVTCPGGAHGTLESDWYFTADAVHARLRSLIRFDESDRSAVLAALNALNTDWYLARYAADGSDHTVFVAADAFVGGTATRDICADLLDTLLQRAEDAYESLRPFDLMAGERFESALYPLGAPEGTMDDARANAGLFMDMLRDEGIDFTDYGEFDGQYLVESVCTIEDGGTLTSEWIFDGRYVIGAVWNCAAFDAADYVPVLETLNALNVTNGTLKFLADRSDDSVTAECYQLLPDEDGAVLLRLLYARLLGLVQYEQGALHALG